VIPAVVAGLVCAGAVPIVGAGVFIRKRTWVAARNVVLSTLLNLGLNWALLPTMGIQGAAIATLISYLLFLALMAHAGSLHLAVPIPWGLAARAAAAALAMYAILAQIHMSGRVSPVAIKVVLGVAVYGVLILAIEKTAREGVAAAMARIRE
jgi:O-antigen/teichoic acid export membrane protein